MFGGLAPDPNRIKQEGSAFLKREYPNLDYITSCVRSTEGNAMTAVSAVRSIPASLPSCTPAFCGKGIGSSVDPTTASCLCHEQCMSEDPMVPCCPLFPEVPTRHHNLK
jgi:hypothetical protein